MRALAKPDEARRLIVSALACAASGFLLWLLLVPLDSEATAAVRALLPGSDFAALAAPVLVEEMAKLIVIVAIVRFMARHPMAGDVGAGPGLALAAIVVFATAENLAYYVAFPGSGIFGRLFWSLPVHLAAGMAVALAAALGRPRGYAAALAFALSWHLAANAMASAALSTLVFALGAAANLAVIVALSRLWLNFVIIRGINDGKPPRS